ncbi:hypothetical protein F2Q69_00006041 [Brassica cretica]|uniref:Uncharacterized protein n=1 Tax=Brassica cretica TaxID=69181 RepID=A0A8S9NY36_BRACR|nr:hypothetical protein F2Q69_00006041 [Brassica cretica]
MKYSYLIAAMNCLAMSNYLELALGLIDKSESFILERASRDEPSYICLHLHASLFTQTKLVPEIYTKDEINEMFYGVCGAQEKYEGDFQMKLDGVYHPLNDSIGWLTTRMEEMRHDIAKIQQATDASRHTSIDRRQHASIDNPLPTSIDHRVPASVDNIPPHSPPMKSQQDFHTREEIDQLVAEIYRALDTTEDRLYGRCDDIYFPMDLSISALTFKIEAIQGELVEIQSYISRRPEASALIDRRNNISTDIRRQTSIDEATNRGRLVEKVKSDMSETHYHGEEISADTYATLRRHQFNLESHEDRLQRMENTTTTMKEKWRRGDEAMRDFTGTWNQSSPPTLNLTQLLVLGLGIHGIGFFKQVSKHLLDRPLSQRRIYARIICKRKPGSSVSYDNHYPRDSYHPPAVHQVVEKPGRYIKRKLLGPATIENRETPSLLLRDLLNWELSAERVQMGYQKSQGVGDLEFGLRSLMNSCALSRPASTHQSTSSSSGNIRAPGSTVSLHRLLDAIRSPELLRLWQEVSGSIAPGPGLE